MGHPFRHLLVFPSLDRYVFDLIRVSEESEFMFSVVIWIMMD
jgi:hypothetical protein